MRVLPMAVLLAVSSVHAAEIYALNTGESGARRLDMQSEFIHKESTKHLERAGLTTGYIVIDVGCGTGFMTRHMASIVGPKGHVYAIDARVLNN